MGFRMMTKHGYNMFDLSSLLQKSIRRGKIKEASFAAGELYWTYYKYVWKRLLTISAEDCYGIMTKEIVALKMADDEVNKGKKAEKRDWVFLAKAVVLLCMARKNRDACYVACNLFEEDTFVPPEDIPHLEDFESLKLDEIPDWTWDVHTLKGKRLGKDDIDMVADEQQALFPLERGIFDDGNWDHTKFYDDDGEKAVEFRSGRKSTQECIEEYFGKMGDDDGGDE